MRWASSSGLLGDATAQRRLFNTLYQKPWVVYAKRPFAGPAQVLDYLGRYTHRVAISTHRLVSLKNDAVRFRYKDYAHGNRRKVLSLQPAEFIRRFLLHIVPRASCASAITAFSARPARRRNWPGRVRRSRCPCPIRSWWSRSKPSCTASTDTSGRAARTAERASSCRQRQLRPRRCACCICGDRREIPVALAIGVLCSWPNPRHGPVRPFAPVRSIRAFARAVSRTSPALLSMTNACTHPIGRPHRHAKRLTPAPARLQSP